MNKLIVLGLLVFGGFKAYGIYQKKEAAKPYGIYRQFINAVLYGEHNQARQFIEGDNAQALLDQQLHYYQYANRSLILAPIHKNRYELRGEEYSEDGKKVNLKVYQVIKGGTARVTSPRSIEFITKNHEATLIQTPAGWKVTDFRFGLATPLESNRLDWTGMDDKK